MFSFALLIPVHAYAYTNHFIYHCKGAPDTIYFLSFDGHCTWGNKVRLYRKQLTNLRCLIATRMTFATRGMARPYTHHLQLYMQSFLVLLPFISNISFLTVVTFYLQYSSVSFTKKYLRRCIDPKLYDLPIKSRDGNHCIKAHLFKGVDNRATITRGWAGFSPTANMKEREIYAFAFKRNYKRLRLTVHAL